MSRSQIDWIFFEWIGDSVNSHDKIEQIIVKFSIYPTILKIKQKIKIDRKFSFQFVSEHTVNNVVKNLPSDKAAASENPVGILKNSEFCFSKLTKCNNKAFNENKFPDTLNFPILYLYSKTLIQLIKQILDQFVFYLYCLKRLKKLCMINFMNMRRHF